MQRTAKSVAAVVMRGGWTLKDWDLLLLRTTDYPLCFERPRRS
jgi:hypothetical protein